LAEEESISRAKILAYFGYKVVTRNIRSAINKLLQLELIAYTIPDKPRSKAQKYRITQKGKVILKSVQSSG
jgi:ATP-dependent DNA helicase RecG